MKFDITVYIKCPRFGGLRPAPACAHYDRYRFCRRNCRSLEDFVKEHPDFPEMLAEYARRAGPNAEVLSMPARFSGQKMPDSKLTCRYCSFKAQTMRGLNIHYKRSHECPPP